LRALASLRYLARPGSLSPRRSADRGSAGQPGTALVAPVLRTVLATTTLLRLRHARKQIPSPPGAASGEEQEAGQAGQRGVLRQQPGPVDGGGKDRGHRRRARLTGKSIRKLPRKVGALAASEWEP